jgi:hypothetical protein
VKLTPFISVPFWSVEKREPSLTVLNQMILLVSTPPVRSWLRMLAPMWSSTSAVSTAVRSPKVYASPQATLVSPPPWKMRISRASAVGTSNGSKRSITSPSATPS